ncbi:glycosyltransferase [Donghicola sp.]|jgi:glycosyltransferase involved in cell wall biosynthesis|uniref:glycosyltransferase n=1 Tax=Donghicola sp. TaxID=1929294 RepID=UPI0025F62DB3|nr:glycosyltransferase [Donghicola sp.]MCT4577701.1 glycosyltransferase [Donghicola sp.]
MLPDPRRTDSVLPWESTFKMDKAEAGLPGVSIVIPIFNSGAFLEKTLRSLLCNDLNGVEIILMDGGSNDDTAEIVEYYESMFAVAVMEKDRGQSDAINKGYQRATQPILYWLNGDDIILPNTLVAVRRCFRDNPGIQVVVGDAYMTEIDFTPIRHFQFSPEKLEFNYLLDYASHHLIQPSVFFSRTAWEDAGPCKEEMHYAMDADLFLGMASKYSFMHIPLDIAYSVYHEECKTRGKRAESITELAMVQAAHGGMKEARATLDILVSLFNDVSEKAEAASPVRSVSDGLANQKLAALQAEVAKNRALLLDLDIQATS